jgi:hypothetical protein
MNPDLSPIRKPRCSLLYALAPEALSLAEANRALELKALARSPMP